MTKCSDERSLWFRRRPSSLRSDRRQRVPAALNGVRTTPRTRRSTRAASRGSQRPRRSASSPSPPCPAAADGAAASLPRLPELPRSRRGRPAGSAALRGRIVGVRVVRGDFGAPGGPREGRGPIRRERPQSKTTRGPRGRLPRPQPRRNPRSPP